MEHPISSELAPVLTEIFKQSLSTGDLPSVWRQANVTPVFKKGNKNLAENYRPVSLTCVTCKIFEHILCSHIHKHLEKFNILTRLQHGFRSRMSCETQLIVTMNDLLMKRDKKVQVDMAILDYSQWRTWGQPRS